VTEVRIHDTLTGELRTLEPREGRRVGIYACGPTVYAPVHVGNARPYVIFSLLKRHLESEGYEVTLVVNVTDVNDKIYHAAREAGIPSAELARDMAARYEADTDQLGLGRPDHEPTATDTMAAIVELIADLVEADHAYAAGGDVYFRVASFHDYGKLSNRSPDDMQQGEDDAAVGGLKEDPRDFALWKGQKEGEDTSWPSPWGPGRPGWHIECSAMAEQVLGLDFEIHGGGSDLVFPHHENEIAQSEAARGRPLARIWMHNGMVRFEDEKMSKSVGNIRSLSGALEEHGRDALVMYFVGGHYRQPVAFSPETLGEAARSVGRIRETARRLTLGSASAAVFDTYAARLRGALSDDFNTPAAKAAVFDAVGEANRLLDAGEEVGDEALRGMLAPLGLDNLLDPDGEEPPAEASELLAARQEARERGDYEAADAHRDALTALGWQVRDTADGPRLIRA